MNTIFSRKNKRQRSILPNLPSRNFSHHSTQKNEPSTELSEVKKIVSNVLSLLCIFLAVVLLVSLLSYNNDTCITQYGFFETNNFPTGSYGNCIAGFFFNLLGDTAYLFVFMLLFLGYWMVRNKTNIQDSLTSSLFVAVGVSVIVFLIAPAIWDLIFLSTKEPSNMGKLMLDGLLPAIGPIGSIFILFLSLIICLTLIFKISWVDMMQKTGYFLCSIVLLSYSSIYNFLSKGLNNLKNKSKDKAREIQSTIKTEKSKSALSDVGLINQLKAKKINSAIKFSDVKESTNQNTENTLNVQENLKQSVLNKPIPIVGNEETSVIQKNRFTQPQVDLLKESSLAGNQYTHEQLIDLGQLIEKKLADFKIGVKVVDMHPGPVITRFELDLDNGVKVSQVSNLAKDLARSLSLSSVRIVEVIPGKPHIGIEIPNQSREMVSLREIIASGVFNNAGSPLTIAVGKDISGKTRIVDLATMPHLLVAGTTGSGKSVAINAMILSILYKASPEDVRLILIDPKMIELSIYEDIPHLIAPVVTQMEKAFSALQWCVFEMNRRYKLMTEHKFTHISEFNKAIQNKAKKGEKYLDEDNNAIEKMPYIVVFIDEFADLILVEGKKIENLVARLAGKARAAGIHLVVATQRPSVNVITGVIKANIPTRIAFQLPTKIDSRTILEQSGAEQLLGKGDMLYLAGGAGISERIHGAFVDRDEVKEVVEYWKSQAEVNYLNEVVSFNEEEQNTESTEQINPIAKSGDDETIYRQAVELVIKDRRASISYVQRKLQIGYNRSANLIERMESDGIVSSPAQNGNRSILINTVPNFEQSNTQDSNRLDDETLKD